jgi:dimethylamine/trimethylamine dehydrogenase
MFQHIAVATGATWRRDGVGRWHTQPIPLHEDLPILTPDDLLRGARPYGERVAIFDDDHYYMGGVLTELLAKEGYEVILATPAPIVSSWTVNTMEQHRIQARMLELGVELQCSTAVVAGDRDGLKTVCVFTGRESRIQCEAAVMVTGRLPNDALLHDFEKLRDAWADAGLRSVRAVGDALAPGTIAAAVWEGRRYAEELDVPQPDSGTPFRREVTALAPVLEEHVHPNPQ